MAVPKSPLRLLPCELVQRSLLPKSRRFVPLRFSLVPA
jgi:hypothetical protein